mmetsp:Transcript_55476/g.171875  ORF Transcript_55476/g.171875 Transcript_55476/m.171875 type:complete len:220 (+) Transcript_55476:1360-2019(+)
MCTPTEKFPLGRTSQDRASSMSSQPGGSMEHTQTSRKSLLPLMSLGFGLKSAGGRHASTSSEKGSLDTLCSMRIISVSTLTSPVFPRVRVQWPFGYSLNRSQTSTATITRVSSLSSSFCDLSVGRTITRGKRGSAGMKARSPGASAIPSCPEVSRDCMEPGRSFLLRFTMLTTRPLLLPLTLSACIPSRACSMSSASETLPPTTPWRSRFAAPSYSTAC